MDSSYPKGEAIAREATASDISTAGMKRTIFLPGAGTLLSPDEWLLTPLRGKSYKGARNYLAQVANLESAASNR
jgi:hypothetical protein